MEVEPTEGGGTVAALFDVDNANMGRGYRSISFAPYYVTYTDTLSLTFSGQWAAALRFCWRIARAIRWTPAATMPPIRS